MAEPSGRSHSGMGSNAEGDVVMCGCSPDARPGHHAIATLADWAHANGAHWQAETLECRFLDENYGYGIVAKADIPAGTTVLSIPRHLMVTSHAARQHKTGRAIEAAGLSSAVSGVECLYLYLISLRYDTEDASVGPHAPYVHALPSSFTCPIWLCERECEQWLPGTEADSQVRAIRAKLRASYDKLARLLLPTAPAVFKPAWYTWRNYLWAYCAYTSRCFPATLLRPQVPRPVRGSGREATELLPMQGEGAATKGSALAGRESVDLAADVAADAAGHGAPSHGEEAAGQVPWEAPVREAVPSSGTQAGFLAKGHGHGQTGGARRSYHGGGHLGGQEDGDAVDGSFGMPGVKLPGGADEEEEGSEVDGWDAPGMLIPFLDMANHMDRTPVSWVLDGDSVALRVEADQVVGCQLFNNYGSKRSVSTMLTYGFCDPENPWDSVHIRLGLPVATDDLASVRSMLRRTLGIRHSQYLSMPAGLGAAVAADRAAAAMTSAMDVAFKAGDDVAVTADGDDGVKAGGGVAATAGGGASLTAGRDPCRPPYRVPRELLASLLISLGDEATLYRLTHSWAHDAPCTVKSSDKPSGTSADTSARAAQVLQAAGPLVHLRLLQLLYTHLATLLNALGGGHDGADARRCREAIVGGARGSREGTGGEDIVETSGGCPTRGGSDAKKLPTKEARRGDVSEGMYGTVGCSMATSGEPSGGRKAVCGAENGGKNEEVSERGCGRQRVTGYSCGAALMGSYRESQRRVLVGGLASTLEEMGDLMRGLGAGVGEVTGPGVAAPLRLKSEGSCCAASASISSRVARWQRWVLAQGGTCHIDLHPTRGWTASLPLAAGTPLMSIPSNLILTAPAVTAADPELRQVASAMHASLQSRAGPETATGAATTAGGGRDVGRGGRGRGEDEEEDADGCAIRCVRDEVVLALYLCQHVDLCAGSATAAASGMASQGNRSSECVDPADGTDLGVGGANGPPGGMCPWQPFLDALLPESEGSALLWSQGELARLGPGSPAHSRVCQQREELANEYRQLVLPCMRAFPSFFSPPARFSFQRFLWASAACEARRVLLPCDQVQGKRGAPPFDAGHKRSSCSVPSVPGLMGSPGRGVTSLTGGSVPDATVGDVSSDAGALRPASSVTGGNEEARARGTDALGQEAPPWVGVLPIPWVPRPSLQGAFFPSFRSYPRPGCLVDGSASAAGAPAGSTCDRGGVYASSADGQVHAHEPDSPTCSGRVHRGGQTLGGQHQERASRDPPGGQAADKECSGPALGEREQPRSETCADVSRDACWGMRGVDGTAGWQEGSQNRHARAAPAGSVYVLTAVCDVAAGADVRGTLAPGSSLVGVDNTELLLRTGEALEGNPLEGVEVELGPELLAGEWDDACGDDEGEEGRDGEEVDEEEGGGGGTRGAPRISRGKRKSRAGGDTQECDDDVGDDDGAAEEPRAGHGSTHVERKRRRGTGGASGEKTEAMGERLGKGGRKSTDKSKDKNKSKDKDKSKGKSCRSKRRRGAREHPLANVMGRRAFLDELWSLPDSSHVTGAPEAAGGSAGTARRTVPPATSLHRWGEDGWGVLRHWLFPGLPLGDTRLFDVLCVAASAVRPALRVALASETAATRRDVCQLFGESAVEGAWELGQQILEQLHAEALDGEDGGQEGEGGDSEGLEGGGEVREEREGGGKLVAGPGRGEAFAASGSRMSSLGVSDEGQEPALIGHRGHMAAHAPRPSSCPCGSSLGDVLKHMCVRRVASAWAYRSTGVKTLDFHLQVVGKRDAC